ncbi:MAG: hypothetical protein FJX72_14910, partial [Armatimonadetes bacterium]|nr:hypothetical protein [Armatimonadota bacterium]
MVAARWAVQVAVRGRVAPTEAARRLRGPFRDVAPCWSHDGSRIAFLRVWASGHVQLCVSPADLSRVCALTRPEVVNPDIPPCTGRAGGFGPDAVAWRPDDGAIAFGRGSWFLDADGRRMPGSGIWAFDLASGRTRPIAVHPHLYTDRLYTYRSPAWRSDGRQLVVVGHGALDRTRIALAQPGGTVAERADAYDASDWPAWEIGGMRLAFAQGIQRELHSARVATIRVAEPGGKRAERILAVTPDVYRRLCPEDVERHPDTPIQPYVTGLRWAPGGKRILFSMTPHATDSSRFSLWSVATYGRADPVRVSPDAPSGYHAPHPFPSGLVGALRRKAGHIEAVLLTPDGAERAAP